MKVFIFFFLAATILCGYFWATDAPGSGMQYPTIAFAVLLVGTCIYNWRKNGSAYRD
jgi:hypothetical protein